MHSHTLSRKQAVTAISFIFSSTDLHPPKNARLVRELLVFMKMLLKLEIMYDQVCYDEAQSKLRCTYSWTQLMVLELLLSSF